MSKFLSNLYSALEPYTPGEQPKDKAYIKLNTNESPFSPSPNVEKAISSEVINDLNLYPDPEVSLLRDALAENFGVNRENIFVGNGSDDVIAFSIMAFCGRGGSLACPDITYGFYPVYAKLFGVNLTEVPLRDDFSVKVEDYKSFNCPVIIANPNAPTGLMLSLEEVEALVNQNPDRLVIMDEAYMDFGKASAAELTKKYNNLMVIQTFSKSRSLAGLRVGFAVANAEIIRDLETMRFSFNPYNINSLTMRAATAAIKDSAYYDNCINKIIDNREYSKAELTKMGFKVLNSKSNFIFASHPEYSAKALYEELKNRGILVRYFSKERIKDFVRITVGSKEQMQAVMNEIKDILKG
ncbi:MAG: histidinol-phosphate transaminase [Clostridia bacterium]|nr:histidinol-phosphate transaminase [Clostridia bacterium]